MRMIWIGAGALIAALFVGVGLAFAPLVYAELALSLAPLHIVMPQPLPPDPHAFDARPGPEKGRLVAGDWRVETLAPGTFAIGEPAGDLDNYEYLLVGADRALLIDAGSSPRSLRPVLASLTDRPVTVIPTHLHFDHTLGLPNFDRIAMIDEPQTRADVHDGRFTPAPLQFLMPHAPTVRVSDWIAPGQEIDLGGRVVRVLATPGHTATSVSIWDPANRFLFTGDLIYPTTLFLFQPDSSLGAFTKTADRLLASLPPDTRLYGAHCCRGDAPPQAPWLSLSDLRDARDTVRLIRSGHAKSVGFILRRYPVNRLMTLETFYPFGNA
ncbi:MAG: MBL fold metallo-hydrolase [Alphaproteobacteria bacterium]|nr:MBL fold metallo-hydrolase [Alphaproteobacteria bacterium]